MFVTYTIFSKLKNKIMSSYKFLTHHKILVPKDHHAKAPLTQH